MLQIYTDTVTGAVYFCGDSSINGDLEFNDQGISVYHQGQWTILGPFNNQVQTIIRWQDTLIVGGGFQTIAGDPIAWCAYYDSIGWHPYGAFEGAGPFRLTIIENELYAVGAFTHVDGVVCKGVAKRVGGHWESLGNDGINDWPYLVAIAKYQDHLIISGAVSFTTGPGHALGYLDGTIWRPLGPGIIGSLGSGGGLTVYQDQLYVGGSISINVGNVGHGIMRWDGTEFHSLGQSLQGLANNFANPTGVSEMAVHNGLLYVVGQFSFAGHVPAKGIATWDGQNWCGLGGVLRQPVQSLAFLGDTLFTAPLFEAEGEYVNSAARYIGNYPDTCTQINTSTLDPTLLPAATFHITLAGDILTAHLPVVASPCWIELLDGMGRVINARSGTTVPFSTAGLAKGLYIVRAEGYGAQRVLLE